MSERKAKIYEITGPTGTYIGKTVQSVKKRFREHKSDARRGNTRTGIHRAMRKYGEDAFSVRTILECDESEANYYEIRMISLLEPRYNIRPGGEGFTSDEAKKLWEDPKYRAKMSSKTRQLWEDPEFQAKMSDKAKQQWEDPDFREMMSSKTRQQWEDPEYREMQSDRMKVWSRQQWEDPDFRAMQSDQMKQLWEDPDFRAMQSDRMKQQWEDPEFRAMKSDKAKEQWKDSEYRARQLDRMKKMWKDSEYRARQLGRMKKMWKDPEHRAKLGCLPDADVLAVRWLRKNTPLLVREIGEIFGRTHGSISCIASGKYYNHLPLSPTLDDIRKAAENEA